MSLGGSRDSRVVQETSIPPELTPIVQAQGQIGLNALRGLQSQLGGATADQLVAGFTPLQEEGFASQQAAVGEGGIIPEVTGQLQGTARGDFLFGGPGFDEAVQASIRAAQPTILSTFGRAGGTPGGLADTAVQQVASDAFARLFSQERARQQQAQLALPSLGLLPGDVLGSIGGQQQALAQRQLTAPISANEALIAAAGGGVPLTSLLGQSQTQQQPRSGLASGLLAGIGGAGTGASIGKMFGEPGIGAGIGGGLGLLAGFL